MNLDGGNICHNAIRVVEDDSLNTLLPRLTDQNDGDKIIQATNAQEKTRLEIAGAFCSFKRTATLLCAGVKSTLLQMQAVKDLGDNNLL